MKTNQSGFSLIELLVAVLIMAVGILGIAGLQVYSMQMNRTALFRIEGLQFANDMLDRVRANATGTYDNIDFDDDPAFTTNCFNANCTPDDLAEFDVAIWKCQINPLNEEGELFTACESLGFAADGGGLPFGAGSIDLDASVHQVSVRWQIDADGNTQQVTLQGRIL